MTFEGAEERGTLKLEGEKEERQQLPGFTPNYVTPLGAAVTRDPLSVSSERQHHPAPHGVRVSNTPQNRDVLVGVGTLWGCWHHQ